MNTHHLPAAGEDVASIAIWSLPEDVLVETDLPEGGAQLLTRWGVVRLDDPGPAAVESLRRMTFGPVSLENVVAGAGGSRAGRSLDDLLHRLRHVVIRTLAMADGGGLLLSVVPVTRRAALEPRPATGDARIRLTAEVTMRAGNDEVILESALSDHQVALHHPSIIGMVTTLAEPVTVAELAARLDLSTRLVQEVAGYLMATGMVVNEDQRSNSEAIVG